MVFTLFYCRKNPRGILISPGPGKLLFNKNLVTIWVLSITVAFIFVFSRWATRFRYLIADSSRTRTNHPDFWSLYGFTVHWGGFWRLDLSLSYTISWAFSMTSVFIWLNIFVYGYAGKIIRAPSGVMHGKSSPVFYDEELGKALFDGLPKYGL